MTVTDKQIDSRLTEGQWRMVTASGSVYHLDLDLMTMQRFPSEDGSVLRLDGGVAIPIEEIITCEVGVLGEFLLDIRGDGILTYRRTTGVERLERF